MSARTRLVATQAARARRAAWLLALAGLSLAGCKRGDMYSQAKSDVWDRNPFFSNQSTMRVPVAGTVARDMPNQPVAEPRVITTAMLERGAQRFNIFCAPCHARSGDGSGMIVQRGFPRPPDLSSPRLRQANARHFYDVIEHGYGVMYSYADRVPPSDRWAIIAYIRALQLSQGVAVADLPAGEREALVAQAGPAPSATQPSSGSPGLETPYSAPGSVHPQLTPSQPQPMGQP